MGDDPGPERMKRLLEALKVVFKDLQGATAIDRRLAAGLHGLAVFSDQEISSWARQGRKWRPALVNIEAPALAMAVLSIFEDAWVDLLI
jgi:hypothetical protein